MIKQLCQGLKKQLVVFNQDRKLEADAQSFSQQVFELEGLKKELESQANIFRVLLEKKEEKIIKRPAGELKKLIRTTRKLQDDLTRVLQEAPGDFLGKEESVIFKADLRKIKNELLEHNWDSWKEWLEKRYPTRPARWSDTFGKVGKLRSTTSKLDELESGIKEYENQVPKTSKELDKVIKDVVAAEKLQADLMSRLPEELMAVWHGLTTSHVGISYKQVTPTLLKTLKELDLEKQLRVYLQ